jgi:type III secretion protein Q
VLGLENLGPFGPANDVLRPEVPTALRAAYLNGLGAPAWCELEALTGHAVEVLAVDLDSTMLITPECLGFDLGREPAGPATRGFVRLIDPDLQRNSELVRALCAASEREMADPPLPDRLPLRWAAVLGCTKLTTQELRRLEEQDIVLIDDVTRTVKGLSCWLGMGPTRRCAGRVMLLGGGRLEMAQFGTEGKISMTSSDTGAVAPKEAGFDDIPVNLRFELAQWNASLAQIGKLAAGAVIDFGQRVDEQSVSVWVEQRCIGKGQLVAIGERLGVRLVSVFSGPSADEEAQRASTSAAHQKT